MWLFHFVHSVFFHVDGITLPETETTKTLFEEMLGNKKAILFFLVVQVAQVCNVL